MCSFSQHRNTVYIQKLTQATLGTHKKVNKLFLLGTETEHVMEDKGVPQFLSEQFPPRI